MFWGPPRASDVSVQRQLWRRRGGQMGRYRPVGIVCAGKSCHGHCCPLGGGASLELGSAVPGLQDHL